MINGKKILAVIPARGGSKSIPGKNIRALFGKPLIAWTIEEARRSAYIDRLVLSSDSPAIIEAARQYGCEAPFVRPAELARDDTPGVDPPLHALSVLPGYDYVMLLQPTSPLRSVVDIDGCAEMCASRKAPACVTVTEAAKTPYWMYNMSAKGELESFVKDTPAYTRRQDIPRVYATNGAVYMAEADFLARERDFLRPGTLGQAMPAERSVDIDSELDFAFAEFLLERRDKIRD